MGKAGTERHRDWQNAVYSSIDLIARAVERGAWSGSFDGFGWKWFCYLDPRSGRIAYMGSEDGAQTVFGITPVVPYGLMAEGTPSDAARRWIARCEAVHECGTVREFSRAMRLFPGNWELKGSMPGQAALPTPAPPDGWEEFLDLAWRLDGSFARATDSDAPCRSLRPGTPNPNLVLASQAYPALSERAFFHSAEIASWDDVDEAMVRATALACGIDQDATRGQRRLIRRMMASLEGLSFEIDVVPAVEALLLAGASPERVPAGRDEWTALADILDVREALESETGLTLAHLCDIKGGRYAETLSRIAPLDRGDGRWGRGRRIAKALLSPVRQFRDLVVVPMAVRFGAVALEPCVEGPGPAAPGSGADSAGLLRRPVLTDAQHVAFTGLAYRLMAGDKSLPGLYEHLADFHARYAPIGTAMGRAVSGCGLRWPSVLPPAVDLGDGFTAHCLVTPEELLAEGDAETGLNHCVGGYYPRCLAGDLSIVSIRKDGVRHATLSLARPSPDGHEWKPEEHSGHSNTYPGDEYLGHQEAVLAAAARHAGHARPRTVTVAQPYDPMRPHAIKGLAKAFLPLLPRDLRDGSGQRLLDTVRREARSIQGAARPDAGPAGKGSLAGDVQAA